MINVSYDPFPELQHYNGPLDIQTSSDQHTKYKRHVEGSRQQVFDQNYVTGNMRRLTEAFGSLECDVNISIGLQEGGARIDGHVRVRVPEAMGMAQSTVYELSSIAQTFARTHPRCRYSLEYKQTVKLVKITPES